jgi:phage terminase large subunit
MPNITIPYRPRPAFLPFHNRTERESELVCHRRAGKTVALCNDAQRKCTSLVRAFPPPRFAWFYPTRVRAKDIAWPYLKYYSSPIPGARPIESELAIEYPNGGRVTLYGADNSRGVGLWLDGVYYDECDEIPQKVVAEVAPTLADYGGFSVYAGMLKGRHNLWRRYQNAIGKPGHHSLILRASESGIIPKDELARLRETMGEAAYEMQMECNVNASIANAIYGKQMDDARKDNRICRLAVDQGSQLYAFFDIGHSLSGDDWSFWLLQLQGRDILVHRYYSRTGEVPAHYAGIIAKMEDELRQRVAAVYLPHDGSTKDRKGNSASDDLEAAGLRGRVRVVPRSPNIWDGINDLRQLMPRMYFDSEGCTQEWSLGFTPAGEPWNIPCGLDCLDYYTKKEEVTTGLIRDVPVHNQYSHGADALRTFAEAHTRGMLDGTSEYARPMQSVQVNRDSPQARRTHVQVNRR